MCKTMELPQKFSMHRVPRLEETSGLVRPAESSRYLDTDDNYTQDQQNLDQGVTKLNLPLGEIGLFCLRIWI